MKSSYVHIYTGDGKGKTTAAIGLSVRAALAEKKVFIGQFVKGMEYSELKLPKFISNIEIQQFGKDCFIYNAPTDEDVKLAQNGLAIAAEKLLSGEYDLVVLDELNIALYYNLFAVDEVLDILSERADKTEVVITGRKAPEELIAVADLVTEMKEIKHYYTQGIQARKGVEF